MANGQTTGALTPLQNAVLLLKQAQAKLAAYERARSEPIAVVGIGCRFPGADSPAAYWHLLSSGQCSVGEVPAIRWNIDEFYSPDTSIPGKMNTRWGGFLDRVDEFDADFFGISPREAIRVDPQHRILLEVAWEALEDAGIPPARLSETKTGVYVGVISNDYALLQSQDLLDMDVFTGTGSSHAILANRLSYVLNLRGPSMALDTACSSSLVTVDLACKSLRLGETDMAIAAGVNMILGPAMTLTLSKAHMMSPEGRCKAFDASADGYVRGEGCGVLVLKRLRDAMADGDRVLAVVRGTAVNHDGRSNGLSAPNGPAQEAVLRSALADAGLPPSAIGYIEAHGTGTRLGDPIEIEALLNVLGRDRAADNPLVVGSVKTNIGHLESAAGVAGLIKVILMLRNHQIPPHLHLKKLNPLLDVAGSPIRIPTCLGTWSNESGPLRAGVSSFGFGGTNAHVILEEPPAAASPEGSNSADRPLHVVTCSARSPQAVAELANSYADHLEAHPEIPLADVAYAANAGKSHFTHRAAVIADSSERAALKLRSFAADPTASGAASGVVEHDDAQRVAFLFTGQGAQYAGMGRVLYATQPTFRRAIDECAACLDQVLDRPLLSLLDPEAGTILDQTGYTQPVMFAVEYALATMWRSWGIEPAAVMGHSVGEFAAACVAGVYSLEDGLRLIAERARRMQSLPAGGIMAAVFASPERVREAVRRYGNDISVAAWNGPQNVVVSGTGSVVREFLSEMESQGFKSKPLATSHAFHSHLMEPVLDPLNRFAASLRCNAPTLPVISNLTGTLADSSTYAAPDYWARHARSPVNFTAGMKALEELGCTAFLEIGPSPVLIGMGQRCLTGDGLRWIPSLRPGRDEWQSILEGLAQLYVCGAPIDWRAFDRDYSRGRASIPSYPFQRKRYWAKTTTSWALLQPAAAGQSGPQLHPLLGRRVTAAVSDRIFESQLTPTRPAMLTDHKIQGVVVMPGAGFFEMALAASAAVHGHPWVLSEASVIEPLLLRQQSRTLQTIITSDGPKAASFRIVSLSADESSDEATFTTHAVGRLEQPSEEHAAGIDIERERSRFTGEAFDDAWRAEALRKSGLEPGPSFSWVSQHWVSDRDALGRIREARPTDHVPEYHIHPGLLDSGFQLMAAAMPGAGTGIDAYVPVGIKQLRLWSSAAGAAWYATSLRHLDRDHATGDVRLLDAEGNLLMELQGLRLRRVPRDWMARLVAEPPPQWVYELAWIKQSIDLGDADASAATPGRWLIFDERGGLGRRLGESLEMKGQTCKVFGVTDAETRRDAVREFLASSDINAKGIVFLAAMDTENGGSGHPDFPAAQDHGWGGVLDLVRGLSETGGAKPRLWLITRGAQPAGERSQPVALSQSPIWGLGRVIAAEHPELTCTRIDLDPHPSAVEVEQLAEEVWFGQREDQVALRGGERFVIRLKQVRHGGAGELELPAGQPYRLEIVSRGQLDQVALRSAPRRAPGPGEVEIRVHATGLNFRDVLNVLDLYPGDPGPLGGECSGEVVAVGEGVTGIKPGDRVAALAPASFASYVVTLAEFVAPKPDHLSWQEAATIPIGFLSAYYALVTLGRMKAGERVLIHAASGGVGMAAIQLARLAGVEIFATAGSPRKREFLKSIGITHVLDSRSLSFADEILKATNGEGIDLVLNSLTGESIASSLSVLRDGGRFLELGKTDLWDQARVDAFRPGLSFHAIALDHMMAETPDVVHGLLREVMPLFERRSLTPPPLRTFTVQRVVDALRHMARAEHIGKVVIDAADLHEQGSLKLRDDGTYLLTGGLGGLGLKTARWLTDRGARNLVLVGRSAPSEETIEAIRGIEQSGARVVVRSCDVSLRDQVAELLSSIASELPPLRGIFHLAGVLDDGVLREQTRERFDRVMGAKMMGAWHLHELTGALPLDYFVLFSSAAAMLGSPGQGNYAAANSFLDALAHYRRSHQQPALSVNWGSWAEVGMAAKLRESQGQRWNEAGIGWIEPDRGLQTLEQLMAEGVIQAGVLPINWVKFFERIPVGAEPAWLSDVAAQARAAAGSTSSGPPVLLEQLQQVTPGERIELATNFLRQQAGQVLAMEETQLPDARRPLNELGFDSLTGVEFCNRVARAMGQHLNPTVLFDYPTLESLAGYVVRDILKLDCAAASEAGSQAQTEVALQEEHREETLNEVETMSDEEMDALVMQQLSRLQSGGEGPPEGGSNG